MPVFPIFDFDDAQELQIEFFVLSVGEMGLDLLEQLFEDDPTGLFEWFSRWGFGGGLLGEESGDFGFGERQGGGEEGQFLREGDSALFEQEGRRVQRVEAGVFDLFIGDVEEVEGEDRFAGFRVRDH
jgi:hypothetical protein